jgi:hypothetical protein
MAGIVATVEIANVGPSQRVAHFVGDEVDGEIETFADIFKPELEVTSRGSHLSLQFLKSLKYADSVFLWSMKRDKIFASSGSGSLITPVCQYWFSLSASFICHPTRSKPSFPFLFTHSVRSSEVSKERTRLMSLSSTPSVWRSRIMFRISGE